jgi:malate dehydrogenase (oxaloacetate-decarboxylating)(NADP+)
MPKNLKTAALDYHALPQPGKIRVESAKSCATQHDLALAYTPGVAEPVRAIAADPEAAYRYTIKGNLVAVITDGTAVLGLGNVGALAGKPVMEGKAVLFKRFADIDVFDIEVDAKTPQEFINTVIAIAPTFGGINLEDIAAPACFEIEAVLRAKLDIPVMHDDQHGTAVIIGAALLNALELQGKRIAEARIVCLGAGAAGIASLNMLVELGVRRSNILLVDRNGVVHSGRTDLNPQKRAFAAQTPKRTLTEAMQDADVLLGVSGPNLVTPDMLRSMAAKPVVFALSNPDPEISPELAHAARADLIMACGRSDYPNQVNNVLGFPFIFRGALDVRACAINQKMLVAAVHAIAGLARLPVPQEVLAAYNVTQLAFGRDYIIPKPLDPRLLATVPPAVARAAIEAGVARAPYPRHYPA